MMIIIITIITAANTVCANNDTTINDSPLEKNYHTIESNSEKTLKQEDIVEVNSYDELCDSITTANLENKNKTINLNKGNYDINKAINIQGNKKAITITINGNNSIFNGHNQYEFITVQRSNTLILNNITITNTYSKKVNAIRNLGNCYLDNITIKDTYSQEEGSASGGAIRNEANMTIKDSIFINNSFDTTTFGGGAILNTKNLTVTNCLFENNTSRDGSAIYCLNSKNTTIFNCTFKNNLANTSTIYNLHSNISVEKSIFESNQGEYAVTYQLDGSQMIINHCSIYNHTSTCGLIFNNYILSINDTSIFDNRINEFIFNNKNQMFITNSNIYNNYGSILTNKYNASIINSSISSNTASSCLTNNSNESGSISIENSIFTNNTAPNICYENIAEIITKNTSYYNNTCEELFEATVENLKASENTYIGNRLYSQITCENSHTFNYDEDILINGIVTTKEVYNTTISTGNVILYLEDKILQTAEINSNKFVFNITNKLNNSSNLRIVFEDLPNYKTSDKDIIVKILYPEYVVDIITNDSIEYDEIFNYTIAVTNNGTGNGSNILLKNIIPENMEFISSDNYEYENNTWIIERLNSNETRKIIVSVKNLNSNNVPLKIYLEDMNNNNSTNYTKEVVVNRPIIDMRVADNFSNITLSDRLKLNMNIINNGSGKSGNINVKIIVDGNIYNSTRITPINHNDSYDMEYELLINKTGKYNMSIILEDEIFNITSNKSYEFDIKKPTLIVMPAYAHVNDSINLSARITNINSLDGAIIVFKVNNLTIVNYEVTTNNSDINLQNFVIPPNWTKRNYTLTVKVFKKGFEGVISNDSTIYMQKLKVYSVLYNITGFPKDKINLTAIITDERNQRVNTGLVRFKINGITIKQTIKVRNGVALLENYVIPEHYRGPTYNLSLVYGENNLYFSNRNYSIITLEKQESDIDITNTTFIRGENFTVHAYIYSKVTNQSAATGKAIVKINRKTVSEVMNVTDGKISFTYENIPIRHIDCITVRFSGNYLLLSSSKTIGINKFNYR